jgi:glycerol-3-phosphate dehydrogenase
MAVKPNTEFDAIVYPNPTTQDGFYIKTNLQGRHNLLTVIITDVSGGVIATKEITKTNDYYKINMQLAKGIYFIKIRNQNNEEVVKKLLVE